MKLTLQTFLTVDGVMQSPGGPDEEPSGGFSYGGWLLPYDDQDMGRYVTEWFGQADAFLLGRRTYENFAVYWPMVTDPDNVVAGKLNTLPKHVVSSTLTAPDWANTAVVTGDLASAVKALKEQPGRELQVHGSGRLARSLHDLGLIDEYRLWFLPVVLGTGQRLFSDGAVPTGLELVDSKRTSTGTSVLSFRPTGVPSFGAYGVEEGTVVAQVDRGSSA